MSRPKLGEALVQSGVLSHEQVEHALAHQREMFGRRKLGEVLLEMHFVSEDVILRFLSNALHVQIADLPRAKPTDEALATMDRRDAEKNLMLPLRIEATGTRKRLVVAVADPTNVEAIDSLQFKTGMVVQPMIATDGQVRKALREHYHWKGDGIEISVPLESDPSDSDTGGETWVGLAPTQPARGLHRSTAPGDVVELKFYAGPLRGEARRIGAGVSVTVGRGEDADIAIADRRMSRKHFALVTRAGGVDLVDMGSRNGTIVNQQPVKRIALTSGDFVQAGDTIIGITLLG